MSAIDELGRIILEENPTRRVAMLSGWTHRWVQELHAVTSIDIMQLAFVKDRSDFWKHIERAEAGHIAKALVECLGVTQLREEYVNAAGEVLPAGPTWLTNPRYGFFRAEFKRRTRKLLVIRAEER